MENVGFNPPPVDVEQKKLVELVKSIVGEVDLMKDEYDVEFVTSMVLLSGRVEKGLAEFSDAQSFKIRKLYDRYS